MSKFETNLLNHFEKRHLSEKKSCFSFLGGEAAKGEREKKKLQSPVLKGPYLKKVQITFLLYISSAPLSSSTINTIFLHFYDMILIILFF